MSTRRLSVTKHFWVFLDVLQITSSNTWKLLHCLKAKLPFLHTQVLLLMQELSLGSLQVLASLLMRLFMVWEKALDAGSSPTAQIVYIIN